VHTFWQHFYYSSIRPRNIIKIIRKREEKEKRKEKKRKKEKKKKRKKEKKKKRKEKKSIQFKVNKPLTTLTTSPSLSP
jgi:hypothetical protein